ncbi:MAG TPA: DUF4440 domain-containing protein, partial [Candidatus Bathyarchaeia archaeon]|nr:DUF4440 domain-containing protein [Candidatus Bathyarchaeia archaeon]
MRMEPGDDMKRIILLSCAVFICLQFSNAQEKDVATKTAPHIAPQDQKFVDMEKVLWDAWKTKDRKPYEDLLSAEFFEVDVTGTYDKATEISYMDKCDLKDYAILDPQVRHLNDQTVLLTYRLTVHDICEGQPVPEHQIINILFVREKGKWLKVLDSEVPKSDATSGQSARERLIGSWKEVSSEETLPDGTVVQLDEVGLLTYDASGHMSGQTMRRSEPKHKVPSDSIYHSNGYD